ncbi:hypothetical protein ABB07_34350 [Streptomyces incarnatus]|uniref:Secreted protein n=1 Tax=Streptomyces incarnatus TaxID=665007 RepID=A0ABM5TUZ5_9ACTN|nr:hypothetical protein ABB07_34350 [Streptomyces incarnatus]
MTTVAVWFPPTLWIFAPPWYTSYDTTPRSSRDAPQDSWTSRAPSTRPAGCAGRVGPERSAAVLAGVRARTWRLGGPSRPSVSRARTVKAYTVDGLSLVTSTMCSEPGTSSAFVVPRYTS